MGRAVEEFLNTLEKPLQLNEMRAMKEANYSKFRSIVADPNLFGDEVLALLSNESEALGISSEVCTLLHESFWDLYCKKPASISDIPVKKLEGFLAKVKLIVPPKDGADEEGNQIFTPANLPL